MSAMFSKGHIKLSVSAICKYFKCNSISGTSEINVRKYILIPQEIKLSFKEGSKSLREILGSCNCRTITSVDICK